LDQKIQYLLARKQKADSLPPEIRNQYKDDYSQIVFEIAKYAITNLLPYWDEQVNDVILESLLRAMAQKYEIYENRPFVSWVFDQVVSEIDASYHFKDQARFFNCIQNAGMQLKKLQGGNNG